MTAKMKLSKVDKAIIAVIIAAYILIACWLAAIAHGTEDDDPFEYVHAYITVEEPETGSYKEGDIVRMTAHIEVIRREYATPTDLYGVDLCWTITWQRCDGDPDVDEWYDIAIGDRYEFVLTEETARAWYRFRADLIET